MLFAQTEPALCPLVVVDLVSKPMFLIATINVGRDKDLLSVYVSPIVEWTDDIFVPVLEELNRKCVKTRDVARIEDDMMMFGEASLYEFELFAECPGSSVAHDCSRVDTATPWDGGMIEQRGSND